MFVGIRLRFEKSSPKWRIVVREEIEEMTSEEFLNLSGK